MDDLRYDLREQLPRSSRTFVKTNKIHLIKLLRSFTDSKRSKRASTRSKTWNPKRKRSATSASWTVVDYLVKMESASARSVTTTPPSTNRRKQMQALPLE